MSKQDYLTFLIRLQRRYAFHKLAFVASKKIIQTQVLICLSLLIILSFVMAFLDISSFWGSVISNFIIFVTLYKVMYKKTLEEIEKNSKSFYGRYFFYKFTYIFKKKLKISIFNPTFLGTIEDFLFSQCECRKLFSNLVNEESKGLSKGAYQYIVNKKDYWTVSDIKFFAKCGNENLELLAKPMLQDAFRDTIKGI